MLCLLSLLLLLQLLVTLDELLGVNPKRHGSLTEVDTDVDELAEDGIPGSGLFLDHVHPTIEGNRLLALAIIEEMAIQGLVNPAETWSDEEIASISQELVNSLDELCEMLWDMIRYQNLDVESPYNREAALWAKTQTTYVLPLDGRSIRVGSRRILGGVEETAVNIQAPGRKSQHLARLRLGAISAVEPRYEIKQIRNARRIKVRDR